VGLPSSVGAEAVSLAISMGGKDYIFLVTLDLLLVIMNCTCCAHLNTEVESRVCVQT
jgi:hypothetical protein